MSLLEREQAVARYGPIVNGKWEFERFWMVPFHIPREIQKHLVNSYTGAPTEKIYVNADMFTPLELVIDNILIRGLEGELQTFDGCFNIRDVRGVPGKFSWHSYGLALDLNAKSNALGTKGTLSIQLITAFRDAGFVHGGDFTRSDPMHFQYGIG